MPRIALLAAASLACALAGAEPATVIRATELKREPASDAPTVAPVGENAKVDALERKGGWMRVKTDAGAEGWLKMLALRYGGAGEAKPGDSGIAQMLNVARTGTSGAQATTGVRGLDAEQLKNARPNPGELKKMEGYAVTRDGAAGFASGASLQPRQVAYPKEGG
ncbi:MAG: SH3 domain-containing protein [Burkholderiales bacterium]